MTTAAGPRAPAAVRGMTRPSGPGGGSQGTRRGYKCRGRHITPNVCYFQAQALVVMRMLSQHLSGGTGEGKAGLPAARDGAKQGLCQAGLEACPPRGPPAVHSILRTLYCLHQLCHAHHLRRPASPTEPSRGHAVLPPPDQGLYWNCFHQLCDAYSSRISLP